MDASWDQFSGKPIRGFVPERAERTDKQKLAARVMSARMGGGFSARGLVGFRVRQPIRIGPSLDDIATKGQPVHNCRKSRVEPPQPGTSRSGVADQTCHTHTPQCPVPVCGQSGQLSALMILIVVPFGLVWARWHHTGLVVADTPRSRPTV